MKWLPLKKNDVIYAIAPGYPYREDLLEIATKKIEKWGLRLHVPKSTLKPYLFHSQTDQNRLKLLINGIEDNRYQALWAIRGGYGSNRLLPGLLEYSKKNSNIFKIKPKPLLGFSDITSLHSYFNKYFKWPTLHAPVLESIGKTDFKNNKLEAIRKILFGETSEIIYPICLMNKSFILKKNNAFYLLGGNMTVVQSLIGTSFDPLKNNKNKVALFFEDVGERGYRVDRMLEHFKQSGVLNKVEAVFFGEFTTESKEELINIEQALARFAKEAQFPVYKGLPVGHGQGQGVLPFNQPSRVIDNKLIIDLR